MKIVVIHNLWQCYNRYDLWLQLCDRAVLAVVLLSASRMHVSDCKVLQDKGFMLIKSKL